MEHAKDTIYYTSGWPVSSMADAKERGKTYTKGDVTYTFLGAINASGFVKDGQMGTGMTGAKYFSREYTLTYSDLEEAVVPATVEHDGVTYKVVAIQKWGFCYPKTTCNFYDICKNVASAYSSNGDTEAAKNNVTSRDYSNINDHSNDYLRTVTFEEPSNIRYIGDYAFMSCNALESVVIPNTVEDLGQGIFECDKKLS